MRKIDKEMLEPISKQDCENVTKMVLFALNVKGSDVKETYERLEYFFNTYCKKMKKAELYQMFHAFCENFEYKNWVYQNILFHKKPLHFLSVEEFNKKVEMGTINNVYIYTEEGYMPRDFEKIICK